MLPAKRARFLLSLLLAGLCFSPTFPVCAADQVQGYSVEKTAHGATVKLNGELVAEYVTDQANKPFLWPVIGPTGKPITRAFPMKEVEGEAKDHVHHRSIWFGHESINGVDTWTDAGTWAAAKPAQREVKLGKMGSIRHREFRETKGDKNEGVIASLNDFLAPNGKKLFEQEQRITFREGKEGRILDFELVFVATEDPIVFADMKDAGFNVRVAHSIAVESKQGGQIVSSEGLTDAAAWGKPAKWVDYHGPLEGETVGIAILDHPANLRHPARWHVRPYGLFTANPFGSRGFDKTAPDGTHTVAKGDRLKLRYRVILHKGDEKTARIEQAFQQYAGEVK